QRVSDSMEVKFHEAGHILGSAMLEVIATEGNKKRRVLFSGDIGQWEKPILRPPTLFDSADYVVMESTYGDRNHKEGGDIGEQLKTIINNTMSRGGNVVIPTFAVERAQELMYFISQLVHDDAISDMPIFLDSPMAVDVTEIFRKHRQYFGEEAWQRAISDEPPLRFPGLTMCRSVEESRKINVINTPCIIMSTSGMCHAGRIKHHLRHNLGRPENCILFVGYQGKGTLGRQILDGNHFVRIHGRDWPVKAEIAQIYGFSGHADQGDLLRWIGNLQQPPRQVFLTHGEEKSALAFEKELRRLNLPVSVPDYLDVVGLD
ncbi:MAG: MBL fold metallo-hydrolase, partial [Pirellulaceae bacterium]|nr:MBL fold metallo-hydrolase [Pirellulaceae bacterium]